MADFSWKDIFRDAKNWILFFTLFIVFPLQFIVGALFFAILDKPLTNSMSEFNKHCHLGNDYGCKDDWQGSVINMLLADAIGTIILLFLFVLLSVCLSDSDDDSSACFGMCFTVYCGCFLINSLIFSSCSLSNGFNWRSLYLLLMALVIPVYTIAIYCGALLFCIIYAIFYYPIFIIYHLVLGVAYCGKNLSRWMRQCWSNVSCYRRQADDREERQDYGSINERIRINDDNGATRALPAANLYIEAQIQRPSNSVAIQFSCSICLSDLEQINAEGRQLTASVCGHVFCTDCIMEHLKQNKWCPQCRIAFSGNSIHPLYP